MPSFRFHGGWLLAASEEARDKVEDDHLKENGAKQLPTAPAGSSSLSLPLRLALRYNTATAAVGHPTLQKL